MPGTFGAAVAVRPARPQPAAESVIFSRARVQILQATIRRKMKISARPMSRYVVNSYNLIGPRKSFVVCAFFRYGRAQTRCRLSRFALG